MAIPAIVALVLAVLALAGCGSSGGGGTTVAMVSVPDVSGLTADGATAALCAVDLAIASPRVLPGTQTGLPVAEINGRLRAVSTRPAAGSRVPVRTAVEVTLQSPSAEVLVMRPPTCASLGSAPDRTTGSTTTAP